MSNNPEVFIVNVAIGGMFGIFAGMLINLI